VADPQIRIDQLTGGRVLVAPGRSERPDDFGFGDWRPAGREGCPFCEGNESATPPEMEANRPGGGEPDSPGWLTRTVPNLYPAVLPREDGGEETARKVPDRAGAESSAFSSPADPLLASGRSSEPDMFASRPAHGSHEVIINAPEHLASLAELDEAGLAAAVSAWRSRMRANGDAAYVQLILNQGPESGASLEHSHAQVGAMEFVPPTVARERERVGAYRERTAGASLLGEILREEIRRGDRLVAIDEEVALICPWASRHPYEMRIIPRRPTARFEEDEGGVSMLGRAVAALTEVFGDPCQLNLWVRTAPRGVEHFHWHLDLIPRLEPASAFEMATGVDINIVSPESAAATLRAAIG
jgi:UDPglucose--hexose-1-phosphate uridylyltransferase